MKITGVEVLRAIYGAVRDRNWDTVLPVIELERMEQGEDNFSLEFTVRCDVTPISFWWKGIIQAQGQSLEFRFEGRARSAFLRNRIGFCILHPIKECAGKPCRIQHADGNWEDAEFPFYISPHQPFKDLRALAWNPSPGVRAEILFEGDAFETEDQRNWTDASYKTYSTPLELPFPVEVADAELNRQRPPQGVTVCYSLNPQVHAFDDLSLMETLEAQAATVESAAQFCDKGIVISPITLRPRFNPNATTCAQVALSRLPSTVDPRQRTLFTAAWTLGSLSRLLPLEHVENLTFFETTGWQGVLERNAGSQNPVEFSSRPGEIFPVYYVFEALAAAQRLLPVNVSDRQRIAGFAFLEAGNRSICLLTNLTRRIQSVELRHLPAGLSVAMIDETHEPVTLEGTGLVWRSVPITRDQTSLALNPMALIKLEFT